jgi:hypothetical protein
VEHEASRSVARYPNAIEALRGADAVILLPTLNEEEGLPQTLREIPFEAIQRSRWDARPFIIDGGSTDRTLEVAADWNVPVVRQRSRGKGAAIREGLDWVKEAGVPFAVTLDADATYPGKAILPALELLDSGTDLVIGVRQPKPSMTRAPSTLRDMVHRAGNALLNLSAELMSGCSLLDICSGFWAVRVEKATALELKSTDFAIEAELFIKARRSRWTVRQFPIEYGERVGTAKLHAVRDGLRILAAIVRFSRESVGVLTDPIAHRLTDLLRELTTIMLIEGPREVFLFASPERQEEARTVATRLRRARLATKVVIGVRRMLDGTLEGVPDSMSPNGDLPLARKAAIVSLWDEWDETPITGRKGSSPVTVSFGEGRRQIYIDVQAPEIGGSPSLEDPWAQSGGFLSSSPSDLPRFLQPLRFLAQQLRTESAPAPSTMLRANGFQVEMFPESELPDHHVLFQGISLEPLVEPQLTGGPSALARRSTPAPRIGELGSALDHLGPGTPA